MPLNPKVSDLDAAQAFKRVINGDHDAIRVVNALNQQLVIELSAEDEDSVQAVARHKVVTQESGIVDVRALRRVCKFGEGTIEVSCDGVEFVELPCQPLEVKELCAHSIRVTGCKAVVQS